MYYYDRGGIIKPTEVKNMDVYDSLPVGTYSVIYNPDEGFLLKTISNMRLPEKVWGVPVRIVDRIVQTFEKRTASTGVLLSGEKGSGKTMIARLVSKQLRDKGCSTIIVDAPYNGAGFNAFIASIDQPTLILFDEFEKVYDRKEQTSLLTLFDGVYSNKKLFMVTCNDQWSLDGNFKNRPGRFFYHVTFNGVDAEFIREYCEEKLVNQNHIDGIIEFGKMFREFNFDMLASLVEDMNRYKEDVTSSAKYVNSTPVGDGKRDYDVISLMIAGRKVKLLGNSVTLNPFSNDHFTVGYQVDIRDFDDESRRELHKRNDDYYEEEDFFPEEEEMVKEPELVNAPAPGPDLSPSLKQGLARHSSNNDRQYQISLNAHFCGADLKNVVGGEEFQFENKYGEKLIIRPAPYYSKYADRFLL